MKEIMTDKERDRVFALAVLAVARRVKSMDNPKFDDEKLVQQSAEGVRAEVRNILIEHLSHEQVAELAAQDLAKQVGHTFQEFSLISMMMTGGIDVDGMMKSVSKFCSDKLGEDVTV